MVPVKTIGRQLQSFFVIILNVIFTLFIQIKILKDRFPVFDKL